MKTILYLPDGNRRFAKKEGISFDEAYYLGGKSLKLLTKFFILEKKFDILIYHVTSDYTFKREDSSLKAIYEAAIKTLEELAKDGFFQKHEISFKVINHIGKLPKRLEKSIERLSKSSKNSKNGEVIILIGYSLKRDIDYALSKNPKKYSSFRKNLIFQDIDLVIRPTEMRVSGGPIYAMSQAQMIILNKLNPEVKRKDLEKIWEEYSKLKDYRRKSNPYHKNN